MSRRSCVFAAIIMSPVRWHVVNSVRGFIFGVCNLRRGEICWRKGTLGAVSAWHQKPWLIEGGWHIKGRGVRVARCDEAQ